MCLLFGICTCALYIGCITPLLVGLLEQLYLIKREVLCKGVPIECLYLQVINTLMIVQDATLRPVLCKLPVAIDVKWYAEKKLIKVHCCAIVLCIKRT